MRCSLYQRRKKAKNLVEKKITWKEGEQIISNTEDFSSSGNISHFSNSLICLYFSLSLLLYYTEMFLFCLFFIVSLKGSLEICESEMIFLSIQCEAVFCFTEKGQLSRPGISGMTERHRRSFWAPMRDGSPSRCTTLNMHFTKSAVGRRSQEEKKEGRKRWKMEAK